MAMHGHRGPGLAGQDRLGNNRRPFLGFPVSYRFHRILSVPITEPAPLRIGFQNVRKPKLLRISGCSAVW